MSSHEKQWVKPICVRSSVNVNPAKDFNDFAENLRDEDAEFDRSSLNSKNPFAERGRNKSLKPKKMGQSKIKTIQPNGSYPNDRAPEGVMYTFEVELEDGESGEVGAQKKDRWNVGDEVEYTLNQSKWGNKLKLSKPGDRKSVV